MKTNKKIEIVRLIQKEATDVDLIDIDKAIVCKRFILERHKSLDEKHNIGKMKVSKP